MVAVTHFLGLVNQIPVLIVRPIVLLIFFSRGLTFLAAIAFMFGTFPKSESFERRRLRPLLLLPACWIFLVAWGALFGLDCAHWSGGNPMWVLLPLHWLPLLVIIFSAFEAWQLRGARIFSAAAGAASFHVLVFLDFFVGMALTCTGP